MKQFHKQVIADRKKEYEFRKVTWKYMKKISTPNLKNYVRSYEVDKLNREDAREFCEIMREEFEEEFMKGRIFKFKKE